MTALPSKRESTAGFTLIETLVSLALMGLILTALATITAQWLPNWNRGIERVQAYERIALAVERVRSDIASAEFIIDLEKKLVFFDGTDRSVTLVRAAIGPNAGPGLEVVHIGRDKDSAGLNLIRWRAPFMPGTPAIEYPSKFKFGDPVVLLRTHDRLAFSYAGSDRIWRDSWRDQPELPRAIRLTLRDLATQQTLFSTAAAIHAEWPVECIAASSIAACLANPNATNSSPDGKPRS
jgi:general secretion pathway protein J